MKKWSLSKAPVAKMFKSYLIKWLNKSGHFINIYCPFQQRGMEYILDYNNPKKTIIEEPHGGLQGFVADIMQTDYEDTAVTNALIYLGLLKYKNAPITKAELNAFGLKLPIEYPILLEYREQ
ncbi:MAG: Unknown protein [uncultured Sulfurovum sp.]|uniref:Uncharacterized protein n=1 Tax=uncultured Sulfurovum sp. TaxID=269237 RepID=A0A6S6RZ72_9BACT|nr:MAG: Unknown protein [uncultured Sulfurovum sp.]